jgi:hypothetical protein
MMDYGMIGKIEKAKMYASERNRIHFKDFTVTIDGDNNPHVVHYNAGDWRCDCRFFQTRGSCAHTRAMEYVLDNMLSTA